MKSFALLCFLLLASACVFVARADDETPAVDEPKMADQAADVTSDDEQPEADEDEMENEDESEDEEYEEDEESEDEEKSEEDEETIDVAYDEPEKRGWLCRRYRKGKLWCKACGCRRVCRPKKCTRRVCRKVKCTKRVCSTVTKYRIIKYKKRVPYYRGYGPRYVWKIKRVPYKTQVCKPELSTCIRCHTLPYTCGKICKLQCKYRKCNPYYG